MGIWEEIRGRAPTPTAAVVEVLQALGRDIPHGKAIQEMTVRPGTDGQYAWAIKAAVPPEGGGQPDDESCQ